jgi:hypothetical protein
MFNWIDYSYGLIEEELYWLNLKSIGSMTPEEIRIELREVWRRYRPYCEQLTYATRTKRPA